MMWREKYRPTSLAEIEGQDDVIDRLKSFAVRKQLPNLLLWGSRGVGKTSSVLALALHSSASNPDCPHHDRARAPLAQIGAHPHH